MTWKWNLHLEPFDAWNLHFIPFTWNFGTSWILYLEPRNLPEPLLGTLTETSQPRATLRDDCPKSARGPSLAETPKLAAVGEKHKLINTNIYVSLFLQTVFLFPVSCLICKLFGLYKTSPHTSPFETTPCWTSKGLKIAHRFLSQLKAGQFAALDSFCSCPVFHAAVKGKPKVMGFELTEGGWSLQPHSQSDSRKPYGK